LTERGIILNSFESVQIFACQDCRKLVQDAGEPAGNSLPVDRSRHPIVIHYKLTEATEILAPPQPGGVGWFREPAGGVLRPYSITAV
jgi:hypothetical protein